MLYRKSQVCTPGQALDPSSEASLWVFTFRLRRDCSTKLFAALRLQKNSLTNKIYGKLYKLLEAVWVSYLFFIMSIKDAPRYADERIVTQR